MDCCATIALFYWLLMGYCAVSQIILADDYSLEVRYTKDRYTEILLYGFGFILLVDILFVILMAFSIAPAWQDIPKSSWDWVGQNIALPWIAPQPVLLIGMFVYLFYLGWKAEQTS